MFMNNVQVPPQQTQIFEIKKKNKKNKTTSFTRCTNNQKNQISLGLMDSTIYQSNKNMADQVRDSQPVVQLAKIN